jgi:hypothetical protein
VLTEGQLAALRNLSDKKDGDLVGWISIAEARGLTELGLAVRVRSGWEITAAGLAALASEPARQEPEGDVVRPDFKPG